MSKLITVRSLRPFGVHNAGEVFGLTPAEYAHAVKAGTVISLEAEDEQRKAAAKAERKAKAKEKAKEDGDEKPQTREDKPTNKRG